MHASLKLESIRSVLVRMEETIIFALLERAQFKANAVIYRAGGLAVPGFAGSFLDYLLHGTEALHATVRRYTSPDEYPFFTGLPAPILPAIDLGSPIRKTGININAKIKRVYEDEIVPFICEPGDDQQYGSSAVADVASLQAVSKRVHYGMFVAESKFLSDENAFVPLIKAGDRDGLRARISDEAVEERLFARVAKKAATYCQEIEGPPGVHKMRPDAVSDIYRRWIVPFTKDVEVDYLLQRL